MSEPEITVELNGDLLLSASAFAALGEPRGVGLLYNSERRLLGIRPGGNIPVVRSGEQWRIEGLAFWRHCGIIITETITCTAALWAEVTEAGVEIGGDALVADVSDLVSESNAFRELMETPAKAIVKNVDILSQDL